MIAVLFKADFYAEWIIAADEGTLFKLSVALAGAADDSITSKTHICEYAECILF